MDARLFGLLDTLEARYPGRADFLFLRYRYLRAVGAPAGERLALLERARAAQPGKVKVYQYQLTELAESGDVSGIYEAVKSWMLRDSARQDLGIIRALFADEAHDEAEKTTGAEA